MWVHCLCDRLITYGDSQQYAILQASTAGGRGVWLASARSPPTPAAVESWLDSLRSQQHHGLGSVATASPGTTPGTTSGRFRPQGSQEAGGGVSQSNLLGTPAFSSPALGVLDTKTRGRSRLAVASQFHPKAPDSEVGSFPPPPPTSPPSSLRQQTHALLADCVSCPPDGISLRMETLRNSNSAEPAAAQL